MIDEFHRHEVMDRVSTIQTMLGQLLEGHPGMTPELVILMEKAQDALGEMYQLAGAQVFSAEPPLVPLAGHFVAETVNTLRDIAIKFHGAQQLRQRIADVVVPLICSGSQVANSGQAQAAFDEWAEEYGLRYEPNYCEGTKADCLAAFKAGIEFAQVPHPL